MGVLHRGALGLLLFIGLVSCALAQDRQRGAKDATGMHQLPLTGKERLGRKWTDEQRIDNCNVPVEKRGTKLRSSACSHDPSS